MRKELGSIKKAHIGFGGYQDAMLGATFELGGNSWGVGDFWGFWDTEWTPNCAWSEKDRIEYLGNTFLRIGKLLKEAKCDSFDDLVGTPVEVEFDGNLLKSWRVLGEVL